MFDFWDQRNLKIIEPRTSEPITAVPLSVTGKRSTRASLAGSFCILVLLCLAGYHHALNGSFVFDDIVAIVKNRDVTTLPTNISAIFVHDFWGAPLSEKDSHKSYRPFTTLMFNIEYAHLKFQSKHMKLINLVLHCLNTILVWTLASGSRIEFLTSKDGQQEVAFISAILFSVHPVHTEAVCGIVGRAELMFCLCYLLALLLVAFKSSSIEDDHVTARDLAIVVIGFIGLLFKETAITILPVCMFLDYVLNEKNIFQPFLQQLRIISSRRNIIFIIATLIMLCWRLWMQDFKSPSFKSMDNPIGFNLNFWTKMLSQNYLYALNCWILLYPQWLSFDWALGCVKLVQSVTDLRVLSILALYTFMGLMFWQIRRKRCILLCLGLLVIPFLPASGLIKVGFVVAERVLYVPSIGFCILMAHSFTNLKNTLKNPILCMLHKTMLILLLILFLLRTRERASDWLTEEKLFSSALCVCPENAKVHYNIARLATDKLDRKKAFHHYHEAIALYPEYEAALMNLGNLYREIGDLQTAEKYLKAALEVLPEFPAAWMNLGIVQSARKEYFKALQSYENALKYRKRYAVCHYNMGNLFLDLQKYSEAMHHWQEAVALNPKQPKAWTNILTMLDNRGLLEDALRLSVKALQHLPNETGIMFIRANVFGKMQKYIEAEQLYKRVIAVEPLKILYHTNLGVLYHRWGKWNAAIDSYQRAVRINPQNAKTAHENLSKLLRRIQNQEIQKYS